METVLLCLSALIRASLRFPKAMRLKQALESEPLVAIEHPISLYALFPGGNSGSSKRTDNSALFLANFPKLASWLFGR